MAGLLGGMFTYLSITLCAPLSAAGMDWLYFALMGMLSVLLGVFGSVFNTYSCLYLSKDNDLCCQCDYGKCDYGVTTLTVYLMGLMYSIVVILPAVIVYWVTATVSAGMILGGLLLILLISVFVSDAILRLGLGGSQNQP